MARMVGCCLYLFLHILYIFLASFFNIDINLVLAVGETRAYARKRLEFVECGFELGGLHCTTITATTSSTQLSLHCIPKCFCAHHAANALVGIDTYL